MYSLLVPNRKTFSDYVETDVTDGQRLINILVRIQPTHRFISCHPCGIIRPACTRYSRFTTQSPCSVADRRTRISICFTTPTDFATFIGKAIRGPIAGEFSNIMLKATGKNFRKSSSYRLP